MSIVEYTSNVPVWSLRVIPAIAGSLCLPLVYLLVVELGYSHFTALGASMLFLMGNLLICQIHSLMTFSVFVIHSIRGVTIH